MNPEHEQAEAIWQHTLSQVRISRTTRQRRKAAVAAISICLLAVGWMSLQSHPPQQAPLVITKPIPAPEPTLAVMRLDENGDTTLEELSPSELGSIELAFGMAPLVSDDLLDW